MRVPVGEVYAIELDLSALRLIELVEQVHNRTLACSAEANEGCDLATLDTHRHAEQRLGAIGIGEVDACHLEFALHFVRMILA